MTFRKSLHSTLSTYLKNLFDPPTSFFESKQIQYSELFLAVRTEPINLITLYTCQKNLSKLFQSVYG